MTRAEKGKVIATLKDKFSNSSFFYFADSSTLSVADINRVRGAFFEKDVEFKVAKNTLIKKALEQVEGKEYDSSLYEALKGPTTVIFSDVSNLPARIIRDFRKENKNLEKPTLKAAYIDSEVFLGDDQLAMLADLKSKDELIGDVIALLQSPAKNVISALQSGGSKLASILKTLSEKEQG